VICLIDMSAGAMLVWMLEMVQEAETPSLIINLLYFGFVICITN